MCGPVSVNLNGRDASARARLQAPGRSSVPGPTGPSTTPGGRVRKRVARWPRYPVSSSKVSRERTRRRILDAATEEFARFGLGGARVDRIASRAGANKRMLYYYFGDKDRLFLAALEDRYAHIRSAEHALELEHLEPLAALKRLVEFTWDYFLEHPEVLTLLNSE